MEAVVVEEVEAAKVEVVEGAEGQVGKWIFMSPTLQKSNGKFTEFVIKSGSTF